MPATAGRVRMPANNRVHSSAALQTHGVWQYVVKDDPHAPIKENSSSTSYVDDPYASFQGLLALARITRDNAADDAARGACSKCGYVGHLAFQCRNSLSLKDNIGKQKVPAAAAFSSGLDKIIKGGNERREEESESEESESSDSEVDSDIERIIAQRYGRKSIGKPRSSRKKLFDEEDSSGSDSDQGRHKRRRSKKRGRNKPTDDSDDDECRRKWQKETKRKRDESSDEEEEAQRRKRKHGEHRRRRSHPRYYDDSDPDSDSEMSEDSSRKRRHH